jgi:GH18 family chitinase/glycerophosphoryl diester phosphodiesterase
MKPNRGSIFILSMLLVFVATATAQDSENPFHYDTALIMQQIRQPSSDLVLISAHRGLHTIFGTTNNRYIPENSLAAISLAAQAGFEIIELDIRLTKDGVPILMHDTTVGGKTDFVPFNNPPILTPYNPFTNVGANPPVSSFNASDFVTWNPYNNANSGIHLRDAVFFHVSSETPPTLQAALDYVRANKIAAVLALDIKDASSAQAAWQVVAANGDYLGRPYANSVLFKINGFTYPTPTDFETAFSGHSFPGLTNPDGTPIVDYQMLNYWPVFNTNMVTSGSFGSEGAIIDTIKSFQQKHEYVATELNYKQNGGILAPVLFQTHQDPTTGLQVSIGDFNPVAEWIDPNDPANTPMFYRIDGSCCIALSAFYQPPVETPDGTLEDTADNRTDYTFIINNGFNIITTDNATSLSQLLDDEGKRNLCHMQSGCTSPPPVTTPPTLPCGIGVQCLAAVATAPSNPIGNAVDLELGSGPPPQPGNRVAYYDSWSVYENAFYLKSLDTQGIAANLTTLNYSFENIDPVNLTCLAANQAEGTDPTNPTNYDGASDAYADYQLGFTSDNSVDGSTDQWGQPLEGNFNQLRELKAKYPNLKVLVTLGGWTFSKFFSDVAATDASRKKFVSSCINLYIQGNLPVLPTSPAGGPGTAAGIFDGFDIDWEYPASPNGNVGNHYTPQDTANFTALLAEFRSELNAQSTGTHYMLTAAIPAGPTEINAIQIPQIAQYLDYGDVMAYDFHGAFETNGPTNFQSPVFDSPASPAFGTAFTIQDALLNWIDHGFPANKLNLGVAFYARGWTGVPDGGTHGLYQSVTGATAPFPYSQEAGVADYKELEAAGELNNVYFDPTSAGAWVYDGTNFFGLEVPYSLEYKLSYIHQMGLGGIMMYALENDDASNSLFNAAVGNTQSIAPTH